MDNYDKINAVIAALNDKNDTVFRVVHRGVLQSGDRKTTYDARHWLADLTHRWEENEFLRIPTLLYFIGGPWASGGSHAGIETKKQFDDRLTRLYFVSRMRNIYGKRFNFNLGDGFGWRE